MSFEKNLSDLDVFGSNPFPDVLTNNVLKMVT